VVRGSICTIGTTGFAYPPSRMEKVIKIKLIKFASNDKIRVRIPLDLLINFPTEG
jgi:hypothetical protein